MTKLTGGGVMNLIEAKWLGSSMQLSDTTVVKSAASDTGSKKKKNS